MKQGSPSGANDTGPRSPPQGRTESRPTEEWFISSSDAADFGMLETVPVTDGDDEYSFEVPEEHSMKLLPLHTKVTESTLALEGAHITWRDEQAVVPFESVEPVKHDDECSTLTSVIRKSACARLAMDSLCAVGRCYTCGREHA